MLSMATPLPFRHPLKLTDNGWKFQLVVPETMPLDGILANAGQFLEALSRSSAPLTYYFINRCRCSDWNPDRDVYVPESRTAKRAN
jgi:hypothetical protein